MTDPLPRLLALLTLVTGFVDAVSYLTFGHVFVANMTGNVVFLGFALAGAPAISIGGSVLSLAAFLAGAAAGGRLALRFAEHRGHFIGWSALLKTALLAIATVAAALGAPAVAIIPELGLAMGIQNALARKLAIADMTTTVLTMTLTGIAADSSLAGGTNPHFTRRIAVVFLMFLGGLAGAAAVLHAGITVALAAATAIVALVGASSYALGRGDPAWVHPSPSAHQT